jgi:hypothetical protein
MHQKKHLKLTVCKILENVHKNIGKIDISDGVKSSVVSADIRLQKLSYKGKTSFFFSSALEKDERESNDCLSLQTCGKL